ncbi:MAG: hypothetical protein LWW86_10350 [Micrococcales bacterium]|nr:hypothetical protein [Micrococcales bacterium]
MALQRQFHEVLAEAIRRRGLPLERLQRHLTRAGTPVSIATLSYWQSGRSLPTRSRSLDALVQLERLLEVEPGQLVELAAAARLPRGRNIEDHQHVLPLGEVATAPLAKLGLAPGIDFTQLSAHDRLTVGPERSELTHRARTLHRCDREGARAMPLVVTQDAAETVVPAVEAVAGCRLGRVIEVPRHRLVVGELLAPRPMAVGELLTEVLATWAPTRTKVRRIERSIVDELHDATLEVVFHPAALPSRVLGYVHPSTGRVAADGPGEWELPVRGCEVQSVRLGAEPGVHGIRWDWP